MQNNLTCLVIFGSHNSLWYLVFNLNDPRRSGLETSVLFFIQRKYLHLELFSVFISRTLIKYQIENSERRNKYFLYLPLKLDHYLSIMSLSKLYISNNNLIRGWLNSKCFPEIFHIPFFTYFQTVRCFTLTWNCH
jgi:hypothetical protein